MAERIIEGLEECCADLLSVKPAVCVVAVTRGLHAAGEVIERAIDIHTPVRAIRDGGDKDYPSLITDLQVKVTLDSGFRGGFAEIGFFKQAFVAQMVEFGHRMVGHSSGKDARKEVGTVPAHPFIRPAADVSEVAAVEAFIAAVDDSLAEFEGAA